MLCIFVGRPNVVHLINAAKEVCHVYSEKFTPLNITVTKIGQKEQELISTLPFMWHGTALELT
ncbi:MAG: hypothetical protein U5M51_15585 [Emticicia sp.]|nr:hypothetical protein [Emticicia sp.]